MPNEKFDNGLAIRKEVLGKEYVEAALGRTSEFERDFQTMVTEYCWGGTWARGVLDRQRRSILNLGMLAGMGRFTEFELHMRAAIVANKLPLQELREVLLQIAVYCGIPTGVEVHKIARKLLTDQGLLK